MTRLGHAAPRPRLRASTSAPRRPRAALPHLAAERQADVIAARLLAGRPAGERPMPRPAAPRIAAAGPGAPLPPRVRAPLEHDLDADLSLVRLHRDAGALLAARAAGAHAVTSGRDIFFGASAPDLQTEAGRRVLYHELVHTLQQTGRLGLDGRLHVTVVDGHGDVQCKGDDTLDGVIAAKWMVPAYSYESVRAIYADGFETDAETVAAFAAVDPLFASPSPGGFAATHPSAAALIALTTASSFTGLSDRTKSFYYDCLKGIEQYDAAITVLEANDRRLLAAWGSEALYRRYRRSKYGWKIVSAAGTDPDLRKLYPARFLEGLRRFLYAPDLRSPGVEGTAKLTEPLYARIDKTDRPYPNEVTILAFFGARELVEYLPDLCGRLSDEAGKADGWRWERKATIARWLSEKPATDPLFKPDHSPEVATMLAGCWLQVQAEATKAKNLWERTRAFRNSQTSGGSFEGKDAAAAAALAHDATKNPLLTTLDAMVMAGSLGQTALAKNAAGIAGPELFDTATGQWRELLDSFGGDLADGLAKRAASAALTDDAAVQVALVIADLGELRATIGQYSRANDDVLTAAGFADEREAARIRIARKLRFLAERYALPEAKDLADQVLAYQWQIAITGNFAETPVELGDLTHELNTIEGVTPSGLSLYEYETYLWSKHYAALADVLTGLLTQEADFSAFSETNQPLAVQALELAKTMGKPRRFLIKQYQYVYQQPTKTVVDKGVQKVVPDPKYRFVELVRGNQRYQALVAVKVKELPGYEVFNPISWMKDGIIVWFLPNVADLVTLLKGIPGLDAKVMAQWTETYGGKGASKREPSTAITWEWLLSLGTLAEKLRAKGKGGAAEADQLATSLQDTIAAESKDKKTAADKLLRRATTHDRVVYARTVVTPALADYDRTQLGTWDRIEEALALYGTFAGKMVHPQEPAESQLQAAALVFDTIDALTTAIGNRSTWLGDTGPVPRYDVLGLATPLVEGALDVFSGRTAELQEIEATNLGSELATAVVSALWLKGQLTAAVGEIQRRTGLTCDPGDMSLKVAGWSYTIKPAGAGVGAVTSFALYGKRYDILQINEKFTYEPEFAAMARQNIAWPGPLTGAARLLDASGNVRPRKGDVLMIIDVWTLGKDQQPVPGSTAESWVITDRDDGKLAALAALVADWAAFAHLRNAGFFIEAIATIYLELAEMIPGLGPAISAGRLIATILDLVLSGDFTTAVEAFGENGLKVIKDIFADLASKLDLVWLVKWFLFGDAPAIHANVKPKENAPSSKQSEVMGRGGKWARIIRALKNVLEIGKRILGTFLRVKKRVEGPFRRAQIWVLSHKGAALVLGLVDQYWDTIAAITTDLLIDSEDEQAEPGIGAKIKTGLAGGMQGVLDMFGEAVELLRTFELPEELISVEFLLDFAIDFAISGLGLKYKKPIQVIRAVLEKLGAWQFIVGKAADAIRDNIGDPNALWQGPVREFFQGKLDTLRKDLLTDVFDKLAAVPLLKDALTKPKSKPVEIQFAGTEFPESQPYRSAGGPRAVGRGLVSPGEGAPLAGPVRAEAEAGLGHDFGHVRLHHGGEAERVTGALGAEAVTSGSHVFFRAGLSPTSGFGAHVLRHELAHVVQQTGERPLGQRHDPRPTLGEPGRGLTYDPAREAAADRAATEAASGGHRPGAAISVGGSARGVQPGVFAGEVVRGLLAELRNFEAIERTEKHVDEKAKLIALSKFHGDELSVAVAKALPDKLLARILAIPDGHIEGPFHLAKKELLGLVEAAWKETMPKAMYAIIDLSRTEKSPARGAKLEASLYWYLPPDALTTRLEEYLYAKTGIALKFKLPTKAGPAEVRNDDVVDLDAPDDRWRVDLLYVHLPLLEAKGGAMATAAAALWSSAIGATFGKDTGYVEATYTEVARMVLARMGPRPDVWNKTTFTFAAATARRIRSQVTRIGEVLAGGVWPTPSQYAETDPAKVKDDGSVLATQVKNVGLRLGTYQQLGPGVGGVKDRDAHHTTQFLLLEYFRNPVTKWFRPFPHLGPTTPYPGITPSGAEVDAIDGASSSNHIDIKTFVSGNRGALMPTIYLARHTHQSGVHFRAEKPDEDSRASQGAAVHRVFTAAMSSQAAVLDSPKTLGKLAAAAGDDTTVALASGGYVTRRLLRNQIFTAAVATYVEMRDEMFRKLLPALEKRETEYYNAVSRINKGNQPLTPAETLLPTAMPKVHGDALTKNEVLETTAGFKGP